MTKPQVYVFFLFTLKLYVACFFSVSLQGDVESVASKSPKELTALIEQISGAEDYRLVCFACPPTPWNTKRVLNLPSLILLGNNRERYEELRKLKDEAEENTIFSLQKKKGYAAEKKQVREQKEEAERFNGKLEQLKDRKSVV